MMKTSCSLCSEPPAPLSCTLHFPSLLDLLHQHGRNKNTFLLKLGFDFTSHFSPLILFFYGKLLKRAVFMYSLVSYLPFSWIHSSEAFASSVCQNLLSKFPMTLPCAKYKVKWFMCIYLIAHLKYMKQKLTVIKGKIEKSTMGVRD